LLFFARRIPLRVSEREKTGSVVEMAAGARQRSGGRATANPGSKTLRIPDIAEL